MCPWATVLYAMDRAWWDKYIRDVKVNFKGACYAYGQGVYGLPSVGVHHYSNSGAGAINFAASLGAKKIILLGYDMQYTGGKRHWHGDHPKGLANAGKIHAWPKEFAALAKTIAHIEVVNCTRETALRCWPQRKFEEVLCEQ